MMRRHLLLPFVVLLALLPTVAGAQERIGSRLDWGTVEVLLYPTLRFGVRMSIQATGRGGIARGRGVAGGFEPESVFAWINSADRVIHPVGAPSGPQVVLITPVLRSSSGDSIRIYRRAKGTRWDDRVIVALDAGGRYPDHFDIRARPRETADLLAGMQREAGLSGYDADTVAAIEARAAADSAVVDEADTPPSVVVGGRPPYPDHSVRGKVILEFVVQEDGSVDAGSFHTIIADDTRMEPWAREAVLATRFTPGRLRGRPVAVMVRQAVNFYP